ncbi:MAG: zinc ribbon domain-containing protein [Promethearchaeota archaeon]
MYCSYCGEKLIKNDQKFCQNCGTEVQATARTINYKIEEIPNVIAPKIVYVPFKQQRQMGIAGKYSKLCLILALISIVIGIVSLIIGYNFYRFYYWRSYNMIGRLVVVTVILLFRVGGLIMGVFSKVNSSKAEIFEPYNDVEKAGSIFGVLGIISNSIGLFLSLIGPWSIFYIPD